MTRDAPSVHVVEVLGPGCQKCLYVESVIRDVVERAGLAVEIRHLTDYREIAARGVISTPAVAVDGTVMLAGRVPTRGQIAAWLGIE